MLHATGRRCFTTAVRARISLPFIQPIRRYAQTVVDTSQSKISHESEPTKKMSTSTYKPKATKISTHEDFYKYFKSCNDYMRGLPDLPPNNNAAVPTRRIQTKNDHCMKLNDERVKYLRKALELYGHYTVRLPKLQEEPDFERLHSQVLQQMLRITTAAHSSVWYDIYQEIVRLNRLHEVPPILVGKILYTMLYNNTHHQFALDIAKVATLDTKVCELLFKIFEKGLVVTMVEIQPLMLRMQELGIEPTNNMYVSLLAIVANSRDKRVFEMYSSLVDKLGNNSKLFHNATSIALRAAMQHFIPLEDIWKLFIDYYNKTKMVDGSMIDTLCSAFANNDRFDLSSYLLTNILFNRVTFACSSIRYLIPNYLRVLNSTGKSNMVMSVCRVLLRYHKLKTNHVIVKELLTSQLLLGKPENAQIIYDNWTKDNELEALNSNLLPVVFEMYALLHDADSAVRLYEKIVHINTINISLEVLEAYLKVFLVTGRFREGAKAFSAVCTTHKFLDWRVAGGIDWDGATPYTEAKTWSRKGPKKAAFYRQEKVSAKQGRVPQDILLQNIRTLGDELTRKALLHKSEEMRKIGDFE
jgi:hypothetical protein